jgi:hypothetical protein
MNCWQLQPTTLLLHTVLVITSRHGLHRNHRSSIVALVSVAAETRLLNHCLKTSCITPLFYCCMHVCCGHYLATAAVYRVTAYQWVSIPQYYICKTDIQPTIQDLAYNQQLKNRTAIMFMYFYNITF